MRPTISNVGIRTAIATVLISLGAGQSHAAIINVDGVTCTLPEAIVAANTNGPIGGCGAGDDGNAGGDIIRLLTDVALVDVDNLDASGCPNGLPAVTSKIRINGNDHTILRANTAPRFRVLDSVAGNLTLNRLIVKNGLGESCNGGGINATVLRLIDSTITANEVFDATGGGVAATSLSLLRTVISGNQGGGAFVAGAVTVKDSIVTGNRGFTDNTGGGLDIRGTASIIGSTISNNWAGGARSIGGGLYIEGNISIIGSTVSGNTANGDIGVGGGILLFSGDATLVNSTVSGNLAQGGGAGVGYSGSGGGIFSSGIDPIHAGPGGTITLIHSTVTANSAINPFYSGGYLGGGAGGGILADSLSLTNSIVAGNTASNSIASDCFASAVVDYRGLNFVGDGSCDAAGLGQLTGDAGLQPLGYYGGQTMIHPPRTGSPVIGVISAARNGRCSSTRVKIDQKGMARATDGTCDIGAAEFAATTTTSLRRAEIKIVKSAAGKTRQQLRAGD